MEKLADQNGPRLTAMGLALTAISFCSIFLLEIFAVGDGWWRFTIFAFIQIPLMLFGTAIFLFGCVKTRLFYGTLTKNSKVFFIITILAAVGILVAGITIINNRNKPVEFTDREVYCGQKYRYANTVESVTQYQDCLKGSSVEDTNTQLLDGSNELQVIPQNNP